MSDYATCKTHQQSQLPPQSTHGFEPQSPAYGSNAEQAALAAGQVQEEEPGFLDMFDYNGSAHDGDNLDLLNLSTDFGQQGDTNNHGFSGELSGARFTAEDPIGTGDSINAAGLKAGAKATIGSDGVDLGFNLTAGEIEVAQKAFEPNENDFAGGRFGVSEGLGFGARLHTGDKDGDGRRECGTGIDVGPFSADLQTEMLCPLNSPLMTAFF